MMKGAYDVQGSENSSNMFNNDDDVGGDWDSLFDHDEEELAVLPSDFNASIMSDFSSLSPVDADNNIVPLKMKEWIEQNALTVANGIGIDSDNEAKKVDDCDGNNYHSYLQSAVNLAWFTTKHLLDIRQGITLPTSSYDKDENVKLEEMITSDNLIVLVNNKKKPDKDGAANKNEYDGHQQLEEVKFRFEDEQVMNMNRSTIFTADDNARYCKALGNIFLVLFSRGESNRSKHADMSSVKNNGNNNEAWENMINAGDSTDDEPSFAKRMAAISLTSEAVSDKAAYSLLHDIGAPLSICRLVCDLLEPTIHNNMTLEQAVADLTQMQLNPQMFLFDRTDPDKALEDTCLFDNKYINNAADGKMLFGRGDEYNVLMKAKNNLAQHVTRGEGSSSNILCEAVFLAGYAGSGKSSLLHSMIASCEDEKKWFILKCKFDSKSVPLTTVAKMFDEFFGNWGCSSSIAEGPSSHEYNLSMMNSFHQVCGTIHSTFDDESFHQLCEMIPNLSKIFLCTTTSTDGVSNHDYEPSSKGTTPTNEEGGAAEKRLIYLLQTLIKILCSVGHPVLLALDDLQYADTFVMRGMSDFVENNNVDEESSSDIKQAFMIAGTYRSNEADDDLVETINLLKHSSKANTTVINVEGLSEGDINQLISTKLGLPLRYTLELAQLVHRKSKGNPFFVIQFLKTIILNKMLEFSIRKRRWIWDCVTIDLQMISDGVAELLTSTFDRLPAKLLQALKIMSLFGSQIEVETVDKLNSGQRILSLDMLQELELGVKEDLLEKAGPIYAFSHDLIHQTLYDRIPVGSRFLLHKEVGARLLEPSSDNNGNSQSMHLLGVDQVNMFCKHGGELSREERSTYARANATAAQYAMAASSFEQAQSYIDMGIKLLEPGHWKDQYDISLELFEMCASVSFIFGDKSKMSSCLDDILSNSKSFQDSLNASAMLIRLLTLSSKHDEAIENGLSILAQLGETLPPHVNSQIGQLKLLEAKPLLLSLSADKLKSLPKMTDATKLKAMKFLGMLGTISGVCSPFLLPLLGVRMIKLTFQYGFCNDSILGLFYTANSMALLTDDVQLAYRVGKIGVTLREESPNKHRLRSRLSREWDCSVKIMIEPVQAVASEYPSLYESSMLAGDVDNAMMWRFSYCAVCFVIGEDLQSLSKHFALCLEQAAKYHHHSVLHNTMIFYRVFLQVSGKNTGGIKSYDELMEIGEKTKNEYLSFHALTCQLCELFWYRDYRTFVELCEKHPRPKHKRIFALWRCFFEGIGFLNIARQHPNQPKYRTNGEKAVKDMSKFEKMNKWTFENKSLLLQAELHYLNNDYKAAENAYMDSISSARAHKFIHEEAIASELAGSFYYERGLKDISYTYLVHAAKGYRKWGAIALAKRVETDILSKFATDATRLAYIKDDTLECLLASRQQPAKKRQERTG